MNELADPRRRIAEVNAAEHKQTKETLLESEKRLKTFMDSSTDIFSIWDSELNLIEINKLGVKFFPGAKKEDLVGKNMSELIPNVNEIGRYDKYMEVVRTGESIYADDIVHHPNFKHLALKAFKVGDGLGIIATDITERKNLEKMRNQFISIITHELRTPLTSIKGYLAYVLSGKIGSMPAKIESSLQIANRNTDRLLNLVNDLLDIRRIESGKFQLDLNYMDLRELIDNCYKEIQP